MNLEMNLAIEAEDGKINFATVIPKIENRKIKKGMNSFFKVINKKKLAVFLQLTESQRYCTKEVSGNLKTCNAKSTALSCR